MAFNSTSVRVYQAVKTRILAGEIHPGTKIEPAALAGALFSSVTPVRDALHRLTGERLVEMRAGEGFYLPFITEAQLRDLYAWNAELIRSLVRVRPSPSMFSDAQYVRADSLDTTEKFFERFAERTSNREYMLQVRLVNDRLSAPRIAERQVFDDIEQELTILSVTFENGGQRQMMKSISTYHKRRMQAVALIVRNMSGE